MVSEILVTIGGGVTSDYKKLPGKPEAYRKECGKAAARFNLVSAFPQTYSGKSMMKREPSPGSLFTLI
jgi:hypothetical protein